jgi:Helix-hairpin-helix motif
MKAGIGHYAPMAILLQCLFFGSVCSQSVPLRMEPWIESQTTALTSGAPDEDWFEDAVRLLRQPILLNEASQEELRQLWMLSDALIDGLLLHRKTLGPLLHLNELQSVKGFTPDLIRQLAPYVWVGPPSGLPMGQRLLTGALTQDLLLRVTGLLTGTSQQLTNSWVGSGQRWLIWHRLQTKSVQAGWVMEKDPGEALLQKGSPLVDHAGFHFFWQGKGLVRTIALGDFTVNLGQGLLQWQSLAFDKSAEMSWIKRQGPTLRPHRASGEVNFHRGVATSLQSKKFSLTFFVSRRALSGRLQVDSGAGIVGIGSISASGYHRTPSERQARNTLKQLTAGTRVSAKFGSLELAVNAVRYFFSKPLIRNEEPRNTFDVQGNGWHNASFDFSYTRKSLHFFGEAAMAANGAIAWVAALLANPSTQVDLFVLVRNSGIAYRALYANAFSESSSIENERGFYAGVTLRPHAKVRVDAYADHCVFPWIRYGSNAPTAGSDYSLQLDYRPHKRAALLIRYRRESKWEASGSDSVGATPSAFAGNIRKGWRAQLSYQISFRTRWRSRVEWLQLVPNTTTLVAEGSMPAEHGFLYAADLLFNRVIVGADLLFRYQFFDTKGYQSRIYALTPDLRPGFGVNAFYGKGHRFWVGIEKELKFNLLASINGQFGLKGTVEQTHELRLQLRLKLH